MTREEWKRLAVFIGIGLFCLGTWMLIGWGLVTLIVSM